GAGPVHRRPPGAGRAHADAVDRRQGGPRGMNESPLREALSWLSEPERWSGHSGIPMRTLEHFCYTVLGVGVAAVIAITIGLLMGHTHRGKGVAVAAAGGARALPTLGLVTLFALL